MPAAVFSSKLFQAKSPSTSPIHSSKATAFFSVVAGMCAASVQHDVALDGFQPRGVFLQIGRNVRSTNIMRSSA